MKQIRFLLATLALLLVCGTVQAQFGRRLGRAVENAAKRTVERKAEQKTEEAVGKAIDKATDPDTYKDKDSGDEGKDSKDEGKASKSKKSSSKDDADDDAEGEDAAAEAPQQGVKAAEMAYAKSDFVPGDEIIFDDPMDNEPMGEFPSQWDAGSGSAEVVTVNGEKAIEILDGGWICPLMKEKKAYLPDVFTIEFDVYLRNGKLNRNNEFGGSWMNVGTTFYFNTADKGDDIFNVSLPSYTSYNDNQDFTEEMYYHLKTPDGESRSGRTQP
ncbi:MAG: hypothetical protein LBD21_02400, partial [Tannerellaceae bacterium]|nr:hypothetical protein [Tannerellaceae bacterium]